MEIQIIHIVLGKANPNRMNGVNKVVNSLAEHQSIQGKDVSVWGITKNPVHDYPQRSYKTRLFEDVGKFHVSHDLRNSIELLVGENVVFHFHGGFIPQFNSIAKLLVEYGLNYVFTPHGAYNTIALQRNRFKKKLYIKLFENSIVKNAKHIHVIGESEVVGTKKVFGDVPIQLIPNGQDKNTECIQQNSNNGNCSPVFGFVGRLDQHTKGLDILLEGFAQFIAKTNTNSELRLIGDGTDRGNLEKLAQNLDIEKQVKFYGAKYGREKDELVKQLDFLCLNSRNEGLPGVVLEAASIGIPAIVSKETNMGSYILSNKAGYVTEKNNIREVTEAMLAAKGSLKNKEYLQLSINATRMVEKHFDWSSIATDHLLSYEAT